MTVELTPEGVSCNIECSYCYQNPMRDAGNVGSGYDLESMFEKAEEFDQRFTLFGGEPLLLPTDDLRQIFKFGYEHFGENHVQTNATLIEDDHIEMFKKYNVDVGISIDGPGELNDLRWAGTLSETRQATKKVMDNIVRLNDEDIKVSVIVTLHRVNAGTSERLSKLKEFIEWLGLMGICKENIHSLEVEESLDAKYVLPEEKNAEVFVDLAEFFEKHDDLNWRPFRDIYDLLNTKDDSANCIWKNCDPLTTRAVQEIDGDGNLTNCSRTNKEGIDWQKNETEYFERYLSLYQTPQDKGGCKDCRFWLMCSGQCPGESTDQDWRNKTVHCQTMKSLFSFYEDRLEEDGITPLSKKENREEIEKHFMSEMANGNLISFEAALDHVNGASTSQSRPQDNSTDAQCVGTLDTEETEWERVNS